MPRIKGKPLPKFNTEELMTTGKSDLRQYISEKMLYNMIPKSIWNHVNGLLATGEFELDGTIISKKKIDPAEFHHEPPKDEPEVVCDTHTPKTVEEVASVQGTDMTAEQSITPVKDTSADIPAKQDIGEIPDDEENYSN